MPKNMVFLGICMQETLGLIHTSSWKVIKLWILLPSNISPLGCKKKNEKRLSPPMANVLSAPWNGASVNPSAANTVFAWVYAIVRAWERSLSGNPCHMVIDLFLQASSQRCDWKLMIYIMSGWKKCYQFAICLSTTVYYMFWNGILMDVMGTASQLYYICC